MPHLPRGAAVQTPDGLGEILLVEVRLRGSVPGAHRARVRLRDGRVRHYAPAAVTKTAGDAETSTEHQNTHA